MCVQCRRSIKGNEDESIENEQTNSRADRSKQFWREEFEHMEKREDDDWIATADEVMSAIRSHFPEDKDRARLLVVGCGFSGLSKALYDDGFQHVTSTDISEAAIEAQTKRAPELRHD